MNDEEHKPFFKGTPLEKRFDEIIDDFQNYAEIKNRQRQIQLPEHANAVRCPYCSGRFFDVQPLRNQMMHLKCYRCYRGFSLEINDHPKRLDRNTALLDMQFSATRVYSWSTEKGEELADENFVFHCDKSDLRECHEIHELKAGSGPCFGLNESWCKEIQDDPMFNK